MTKYMEISNSRLSVESKESGWTFINPSHITFLSTTNDPEYKTIIHFIDQDPLHVKEHIDFIGHYLKNRRNNE